MTFKTGNMKEEDILLKYSKLLDGYSGVTIVKEPDVHTDTADNRLLSAPGYFNMGIADITANII